MIAHVLEHVEKALARLFGQFGFANELLEQWLLERLFLVRPQAIAASAERVRPGLFRLHSSKSV